MTTTPFAPVSIPIRKQDIILGTVGLTVSAGIVEFACWGTDMASKPAFDELTRDRFSGYGNRPVSKPKPDKYERMAERWLHTPTKSNRGAVYELACILRGVAKRAYAEGRGGCCTGCSHELV